MLTREQWTAQTWRVCLTLGPQSAGATQYIVMYEDPNVGNPFRVEGRVSELTRTEVLKRLNGLFQKVTGDKVGIIEGGSTDTVSSNAESKRVWIVAKPLAVGNSFWLVPVDTEIGKECQVELNNMNSITCKVD